MPALEVWYAHAEATEVQARLRNELDKSRRRNGSTRTMAKARTKDNLGALSRFAGMPGRAAPDRRRPAADRADPGPARRSDASAKSCRNKDCATSSRLPGDPGAGAAGPAGPVPADRLRPEGGRRGQRRARARGWRCCSATTSATRCSCRRRRPVRRCWRRSSAPSEFDNCRAAGRRRAAAHAGGQRHLPRLGPGEGHRRAAAGLLLAPAPGLEGFGRDRDDGRRPGCRPTASCAAGRSPAPTPDPGTASPSPRTSARVRPSTPPPASSPRPTLTRTSGTTRR